MTKEKHEIFNTCSSLSFVALAFPGCDFNGTPVKEKETAPSASGRKVFAADPPHKQVEKILEQARPTPPDMQKDEFASTSAPSTSATKPEATQRSKIAEDPLLGEKVYRRTCALCHDQGIAGAPVLGMQKDWANRTVKGPESLLKNALQGFRGNKGVMPAKGGNPALSDDEVEAAVLYMLRSLER